MKKEINVLTTAAKLQSSKISLDIMQMIMEGECQQSDEIVIQVNGDNVKAFFKNGGHIIVPGEYSALAAEIRLYENQL